MNKAFSIPAFIISILCFFFLIPNGIFAQPMKYNLNDLIRFAKYNYGFVQKDGTIDATSGNFEYNSTTKLFSFKVDCGKCNDGELFDIKINESKDGNKFDISIENKIEGYFKIIDENNLVGRLNYCYEKNACCCDCGGDVHNFKLKKIK
ncbi:MAG: hypothetical protein IPP81_19145 [Chitinophagaceae bacterium]|nr:hypothetical protein [Chitinophagaceae bacterium]